MKNRKRSGREKELLRSFIKAFLLKSAVPFACVLFVTVALYEMRSSLGSYKSKIVGTIDMPDAAEPAASIELLPNLSGSTDWPDGTEDQIGGVYKTWAITDSDNESMTAAMGAEDAARVSLDWKNENQQWLAGIEPGEDAYEYAKAVETTLDDSAEETAKTELAALKKKAYLRQMQLDVKNYLTENDTVIISGTGLVYQVRIRTLNILPLEFTLVYKNQNNEIEYYRSKKQTGTDTAEYLFYKVETKTVNNNGTEETEEYLSDLEASFEIDGPEDWGNLSEAEEAAGGRQITDSLKIYVGWAEESGAYSSALRKEVDRLKVQVSVNNKSWSDSGLPAEAPTVEEVSGN